MIEIFVKGVGPFKSMSFEAEWAIVDVGGHNIHISLNEEGLPEISVRDHCTVRVLGVHKDSPTIIVDSDEYRTHLRIEDSESKWESVTGRGK
jgi:hypothetical protein